MYDWGDPQRFKFCVIFGGEIGFMYRLARTTFLSQPVFIFNAKTFNISVFFYHLFGDELSFLIEVFYSMMHGT